MPTQLLCPPPPHKVLSLDETLNGGLTHVTQK